MIGIGLDLSFTMPPAPPTPPPPPPPTPLAPPRPPVTDTAQMPTDGQTSNFSLGEIEFVEPLPPIPPEVSSGQANVSVRTDSESGQVTVVESYSDKFANNSDLDKTVNQDGKRYGKESLESGDIVVLHVPPNPASPPDWTLQVEVDDGAVKSVTYDRTQSQILAYLKPFGASGSQPNVDSVTVTSDGRVEVVVRQTGSVGGIGTTPASHSVELADGESIGGVSRQGDTVTIKAPGQSVINLKLESEDPPTIGVDIKSNPAYTSVIAANSSEDLSEILADHPYYR